MVPNNPFKIIYMRIEHAALYVENLENSRRFFEKYFSAVSGKLYHNPKTGFSSYFLSFDDGARLEIMHRLGVGKRDSDTDTLGFAHLAFSVGSRESVDSITAELKADGYRVVSGPRTTGDGYYESCILDDEGNRIEITC